MKRVLGAVPAVVGLVVLVALAVPVKAQVSIMSHGAVGDGSHDDTAAIQSAINALPSGGSVVFPAGRTYRINPNIGIQLRSNIALEITGATVVSSSNASARPRMFETIPGSSNITIRGGTLIGSRASIPGLEFMIGIRIDSSSRVVISGVTISDCYFDGIWIGGNQPSVGITVEDSVFIRNRRNGMSVVNARGVLVARSSFIETAGQGPESGIDVEPNLGEQVTDFHVLDCVFARNAGTGLYMQPGKGLPGFAYSARRSQFVDNGRFGLIGNSVDGLIVADNIFTGHMNRTSSAISLGAGTANATVSGNTLSGNHKGISLPGVINVTVASNRIIGLGPQPSLSISELTRGSGIDVKGTGVVLTTGIRVVGNVVEAATSFSFIAENASFLTVEGNVFRNSARHNLFINSIVNSTFSKNRIEGTGQESPGLYDGLKLSGSTSDNAFTENHVREQDRERKSISSPNSSLRNTWVYNAVGNWATRTEFMGTTHSLNLNSSTENWNR